MGDWREEGSIHWLYSCVMGSRQVFKSAITSPEVGEGVSKKGGYIVFKWGTHQSCSQFDSDMRVWKVLIAFPGLIPSKPPPANLPRFANVRIRRNFFALQHVLLR